RVASRATPHYNRHKCDVERVNSHARRGTAQHRSATMHEEPSSHLALLDQRYREYGVELKKILDQLDTRVPDEPERRRLKRLARLYSDARIGVQTQVETETQPLLKALIV